MRLTRAEGEALLAQAQRQYPRTLLQQTLRDLHVAYAVLCWVAWLPVYYGTKATARVALWLSAVCFAHLDRARHVIEPWVWPCDADNMEAQQVYDKLAAVEWPRYVDGSQTTRGLMNSDATEIEHG